MTDVDALLTGLQRRDRLATARALTLVESEADAHQADRSALLRRLPPAPDESLRIGVSGPPGVGKSSLIDVLGGMLLERMGGQLAVLSIDPSSGVSGGSILGDQTRMQRLSRRPDVYIRPSAAGRVLGGVAARTFDAIRVVESAGYHRTLIETVGVGQSEARVRDLVDILLLVVPPGGGDDLQGIKRGILEWVDLVVINKADGPRKDQAQRTAGHYRSAATILRGASIPVHTVSATTEAGLPELVDELVRLHSAAQEGPKRAQTRAAQRQRAMWNAIEDALAHYVHTAPELAALRKTLDARLADQSLGIGEAVQAILGALRASGAAPPQPPAAPADE